VRSARPIALVAVPVAAVLGLVTFGMAKSHDRPAANTKTEPPSARTLLDRVRASVDVGFSGTVVETSTLTLPNTSAYSSLSAFATVGLLAGSHTFRVWYGGPQRQRLAMAGRPGEVDYFRSGSNYWRWDAVSHVATGLEMRAATAPERALLASQPVWSPLPRALPGQLAWWAAANARDASTAVSRERSGHVAGRSVYRLRITPKQSSSLISSVIVSADKRTYTPLGVKVYVKRQVAPAMTATFTRIAFGQPDAQNFTFRPPPDSVVSPSQVSVESPAASTSRVDVTAYGSGWRQVLEFRVDSLLAGTLYKQVAFAGGPTRQVSGTWGGGVLLASPSVSVLVTTDGRILVGDVASTYLLRYCR
jgi:hypothetical protein